MRLYSILISSLVLVSPCTADDPMLRKELRNESASTGLALVDVWDTRIMVIPFDANHRYFKVPTGVQIISTFGKDGRTISLYRFDKFDVTTISGRVLSSILPPRGFFPMGLTATGSRVAFMSDQQPRGALRWASFDFSTSGVIVDADHDTLFGDWAPTGEKLLYEKGGDIYVFEIGNSLSRRLVTGNDPTWSPDGNSIAYRSPEGKACLLTIDGKRIAWRLDSLYSVSPIRWSPDGRYVVFSEPAGPHVPFFGIAYRLVVYRVADGTAVVVKRLGDESAQYRNFNWILDYQEFCRGCQRGGPFN